MKTYLDFRFDITLFTENQRKAFTSAIYAQAEGATLGDVDEPDMVYPDAMIIRTVITEEAV